MFRCEEDDRTGGVFRGGELLLKLLRSGNHGTRVVEGGNFVEPLAEETIDLIEDMRVCVLIAVAVEFKAGRGVTGGSAEGFYVSGGREKDETHNGVYIGGMRDCCG